MNKNYTNTNNCPKKSGYYQTDLGLRYWEFETLVWKVNKNDECYYTYGSLDWWYEEIENCGGAGNKDKKDKLDWSLVDFDSISELVKVLEFGANKYEKDGWRKGIKYSDLISAMMRHLIKIKEIDIKDEESLLNHTGHIMANAMFLEWMIKNKPEMNDLKYYKNEDNKVKVFP